MKKIVDIVFGVVFALLGLGIIVLGAVYLFIDEELFFITSNFLIYFMVGFTLIAIGLTGIHNRKR